MSNIELSKAITDAISSVWVYDNKSKAELTKRFDGVSKLLGWQDCVSPTEGNIGSGKSTASKESYAQLKALAEKTLVPATKKLLNLTKAEADKAGIDTGKGSDWKTAQGSVGVKMTDLKNQLMRRQDPALFKETGGSLAKVETVDVDHKAKVKETATKTAFETGEQMAKNYLAWIEKNKEGLGGKYDTIRNAHIKAMEASGYKR